jgi:dTDP-4-dehydrorhamnose 3,5-epimerase
MEIIPLAIPDVKLVKPKRFGDARGFFAETYRRDRFAEHGIDCDFLQDNHSRSATPGTIRGLHFQTPPHAQAKYVVCIRGAIFDVAVDIRRSSPTFGQWVSAVLTAENGEGLLVPRGFAHAFCTLEPDTEVTYKVDAYYAPQNDAGLRWDDPDVAITWPLDGREPTLSGKDAVLPFLRDFETPFD